jgi:hypothetical protein
MTLADARALTPNLVAADTEPEADTAGLTALADWCTRYAPWSAVDGDDGLRLDITGSAHLFASSADAESVPARSPTRPPNDSMLDGRPGGGAGRSRSNGKHFNALLSL